MLTPSSYIAGKWIGPSANAARIDSPVTGEPIARAGSEGIDFGAAIDWATGTGGPALRAMNIHDRARMVKAMALMLQARKEELYALNPLTGATRKDGWIDIEGGIMTALTMASKARREMPDGDMYLDGPVERLSRDGTFLGRHVAVPMRGVAVQINAFNFPVWGMLEKLAPALLGGMPVIVKPATQTSYLAEAAFRMIVESGLLPEGAVQLVVGRTGDLLEQLGPQDVVSFTGSAATALALRSNPRHLVAGTRFIAEQDSLNAAVLGPDAVLGTPEFDLFVKEVATEMTVKAGQKCTAVRRMIVPEAMAQDVVGALSARLSQVSIGDPADPKVRMGPLVSMAQKADVAARAAEIASETRLVFRHADTPAEGAFAAPEIYLCDDPNTARAIHEVEAFGPVATILPSRDVSHAAQLANRGGGSLVSSLFTHDPDVARAYVTEAGAWHGRIYINDRDSAAEATGHGSPLPHMVHGGPGRAGGGEELGGVRGILHYMARVAVQGSPAILSRVQREYAYSNALKNCRSHPFQQNFDNLEIGQGIETPFRTVTLADIEHFAEFTGDTFYAHMDDEAARANPFFPGRVAHGYLILSFAAGLFVDPAPGPVLANTGLNHLRFLKPVNPGDAIRVRLVVKRKTRRTAEFGEVAWAATVTNQNGEPVAEYELLTMVARSG
ncbi:phenylacetic acid degradation bifunctional protein PaaZ [Defluviimonas aestuarii]|uniref:phenylacetic acid degradation bifunctional protein PaaZ n=1 Tax=Albidovulum aestuarii TaxID=1130726 RepID=UPI00249B4931|nr:phenylacetic acid degradation bifunctional protein PaaZ [Defluviimonas aestuarii]MDI3337579.1 phenylacetic acid degradation bifunctional protein PaaZ [Defluviimonas aestuarii]